jgi:HEAT repeat protein
MTLLREVIRTDKDEGVCMQAWEALVRLGDQDAISRFIYQAYGGLGFKQPFALLALGEVQDSRIVPALRSRLKHAPYLEAKLAAARSLGMHGHADGFDLAVRSLDWNSPNPSLPDDPPANQIMRTRSMAALALGDIGDRRALGPLHVRMQSSGDPRVQLTAATAILTILNKAPAGR